ncbi:hypothetical protein INT43_006273 [Umbelopsis isabellina]|uniref:Uncharacterized protein n=1 Tax=Mortierella isabellina TaxID=91625 RepID=A0A8H7PYX7_MORIS|nr:hypothetical protein INT43_006273 [Umbelopsis isabellina]
MFSGSNRQPTDAELQREFETRNANLKNTVNETVGEIKSGLTQAKDTIQTSTPMSQEDMPQGARSMNTKRRSFSERFNASSLNSAKRDFANIHESNADAFESLAARNDDTFAQNALGERYM